MHNSSSPQRGASIKPSARISIHHHANFCPFAYQEAMGKYGLHTSNKNILNNQCQSSQYGTDETDNIVSKMARSSSPIGLKRLEQRKSSLTTLQQQWGNISSDSDTLAKSLPAYLPSYSYCRNVSDDNDSEEELDINASSNTSYEHERSDNSDYNLSNGSRQMKQNTNNNTYFKFVLSFGVILFSIAISYYFPIDLFMYYFGSVNNNKNLYDESKFIADVNYLGKKYKIEDDTILHLHTGIAAIFKRNDTGSFIFVYDSATSNFNIIKFNEFIDDVATAAARYLRNESPPKHYLSLDSSELNMESHSEFINKYRDVVNDMGIMLIKNIERVSSKLAMAFHYYCDEYNPLVKRSAIFFTLDIRRCSNISDKISIHAFIEKCLEKKWTTVPLDNIKPLLTRVVNVIINIPSVF